MSHSVTVTRTTTSTSSSAILLNVGYMTSFSGILKLAQVALGATCVGLVGSYYGTGHSQISETFFLLMTTTFFIGSFCLLLSCIISLSTASIISKTVYEVVYHLVAFGLCLAAGITLLVEAKDWRGYKKGDYYTAAAIIGLVLSGLYLLSTILAVRHYRGF